MVSGFPYIEMERTGLEPVTPGLQSTSHACKTCDLQCIDHHNSMSMSEIRVSVTRSLRGTGTE